MKIVSVGCGGFLGKEITRLAKAEKIDLVGFSSKTKKGIDPDTGDLRKVFSIPTGTQAVIYLAQSPEAHAGASGAIHAMKVNCQTALAIAIQAVEAGVQRFIYLSTGSVCAPSFEKIDERNPVRRDSWYALTKLHAEESLGLLKNQISLTIVRPFGIYGPNQRDRLIPKLKEKILVGDPISLQPKSCSGNVIRDGGLRISLCHVEDAAKAVLHFGIHGGPPCVNLASGEALSVREIAGILGKQLGTSPVFTELDEPRDTDLIADTRLLNQCCPVLFRKFSDQCLFSRQESLPGLSGVKPSG